MPGGWSIDNLPERSKIASTETDSVNVIIETHKATFAAAVGSPAAEKAEARAIPLYADHAAQHMSDAKLHQRSYSTTEMYMRRHIVTRWGKVCSYEIETGEAPGPST